MCIYHINLQNTLICENYWEDLMIPYVDGEQPVCGIPWRSCSRLYGVGNVNENRWIFFSVSFPHQEITIYDSLSLSNSTIMSYIKNFRRNVPKLILQHNLLEMMHFLEPFSEEWQVKLFEDLPPQGNGHDCGIMVIKFLECLVHGI